ncbi:uncharacterized protein LOC116943840 isoform X1 [Petromyzon marinus]|uniref:uncharacterized protein LOC116943840 isoform X1 n=1 Tax=Petromyzon marinus TaxID=7757 RepID=UPI003F72EE30
MIYCPTAIMAMQQDETLSRVVLLPPEPAVGTELPEPSAIRESAIGGDAESTEPPLSTEQPCVEKPRRHSNDEESEQSDHLDEFCFDFQPMRKRHTRSKKGRYFQQSRFSSTELRPLRRELIRSDAVEDSEHSKRFQEFCTKIARRRSYEGSGGGGDSKDSQEDELLSDLRTYGGPRMRRSMTGGAEQGLISDLERWKAAGSSGDTDQRKWRLESRSDSCSSGKERVRSSASGESDHSLLLHDTRKERHRSSASGESSEHEIFHECHSDVFRSRSSIIKYLEEIDDCSDRHSEASNPKEEPDLGDPCKEASDLHHHLHQHHHHHRRSPQPILPCSTLDTQTEEAAAVPTTDHALLPAIVEDDCMQITHKLLHPYEDVREGEDDDDDDDDDYYKAVGTAGGCSGGGGGEATASGDAGDEDDDDDEDDNDGKEVLPGPVRQEPRRAGVGATAGGAAGAGVRIRMLQNRSTGGGILDGLFGCLRPVWHIFGRNYTAEPKVQQQGKDSWEVPFEEISELQWLGSGAQGAVFLGKFRGEHVAVKKVREQKETDIKHLHKLRHPNIITFKGVCTHAPCYCIIMEYCAQGQLYEVLRAGRRISPELLVGWTRGIARGMSYLHLHKIIHRDLKSPNVLITHDDEVKISDFGTSKEMREKSTRMSFAGTVAWMAPEVIRNEPVSEKVDIWSFGVVLWELLTGEIPYRDVDSSAIIWGVGSNSLHLPIPASCPEGFKILLTQCWNSKPRNRPSFRQILLHLEIAAADVLSTPLETFFHSQAEWREEVRSQFEKIRTEGASIHRLDEELISRRRQELRHALDIREHYEQKLERANGLYAELSTLMLQLETREKELNSNNFYNKKSKATERKEQAMAKVYSRISKQHKDHPVAHSSTRKKGRLHFRRTDVLGSEGMSRSLDSVSPQGKARSPRSHVGKLRQQLVAAHSLQGSGHLDAKAALLQRPATDGDATTTDPQHSSMPCLGPNAETQSCPDIRNSDRLSGSSQDPVSSVAVTEGSSLRLEEQAAGGDGGVGGGDGESAGDGASSSVVTGGCRTCPGQLSKSSRHEGRINTKGTGETTDEEGEVESEADFLHKTRSLLGASSSASDSHSSASEEERERSSEHSLGAATDVESDLPASALTSSTELSGGGGGSFVGGGAGGSGGVGSASGGRGHSAVGRTAGGTAAKLTTASVCRGFVDLDVD